VNQVFQKNQTSKQEKSELAKEDMMEDKDLKNYKYKVDKVERYVSFALLIIFFVTFKGSSGFIIFTALTIIVFAYYFKFYNKRPSYISINKDEITASQGFFFKLKLFKIFDIDEVRKLENRIELRLKNGEKVILMKLLLSDNDYIEIYDELIELTSGN
jgi:hypothetical protein